MQPASFHIWEDKYQLRNKFGQPVDIDIEATYQRVAKALANVEQKPLQQKWYKKFLWALRQGAIPAGRIISNVGAQEHKPATSTINCTVSGTIKDSLDAIFKMVHHAGLSLRAGNGIGFEFSTLRPKDAFVSGAGATTSGPLSFMDVFDTACKTISSAGGRRGAQMATFDVSHPDVLAFIQAKREDGRFRQFNLSVLITREFMQAVNNDDLWKLSFPAVDHEINDATVEIIYRPWPVHEDYYTYDDRGHVACKVYRTLPARELWATIMRSTYHFSDPGFILIDQVNDMNNNWFCENIRASNPCGEQMLPPWGSCLLGSINLTKYVSNPFTDSAQFDWDRYNEVVAIFTRMLDNVVELNGLPLEEQRQEIHEKRRHGMGFLGLGSALTMLQLKYGSQEAIEFTEQVAKTMTITGYREGVKLAKEKGPAPIMTRQFEITAEMMALRPELANDSYKVGDKVDFKTLWAGYSRFIRQFPTDLQEDLEEYGCRFTHHTSIAPTGTIALSLGNNVSNGIEPSFAHHYFRNVIREGRKTKEKMDVFSFELLAYRQLVNPKAMPGTEVESNKLPDYFVDASDITPQQHVDMQAAAQKWVDSSISKTVNVPTDMPFDHFQGVYQYAYEKGLKGCTTFRFNPEVHQGVLVKQKDLDNTQYRFTLEDGSVVEFKGSDEVEYDGEVHTAANLYDALKEGMYGKY
jgi:ribonucleoside-diphosphate reductase alpha chain